jgi:hypothetical protein
MLQTRKWACRLAGITVLFFAMHTAAFAQATRTWVSGVGDDANPCSRTAPCKTFAGAISKTAASGTISVLDPGGFGTVTITKSITIDGGGMEGSILASFAPGITVNIATGGIVNLRNLAIDGAGTGTFGVNFLKGAELHMDNVVIRNFTRNGVMFAPATSSKLVVTNSRVSNNGNAGIQVTPGASGLAAASVVNTQLVSNAHGIKAEDRSVVSVRNSTLSFNTNSGFLASSAGQAVEASVDDCQITDNGATNPSSGGIKSSGALASVLISGNVITGNYRGIVAQSGGDIFSYGSNRISTNIVDGTPNGNLSTR